MEIKTTSSEAKLKHFLANRPGKNYSLPSKVRLALVGNEQIFISLRDGELFFSSSNLEDILAFAEAHDYEFKVCRYCGAPFVVGYTDENDVYLCEDCFDSYMDSEFGPGKWDVTDDDGAGGYYLFFDKETGEAHGTGIYWTEWGDM